MHTVLVMDIKGTILVLKSGKETKIIKLKILLHPKGVFSDMQ